MTPEERFRADWTALAGKTNCRVLAALSGGKDSVALILLLNGLKDRGLELFACHVHHGIRGKEADRDEAFCRDLCRRLGVPLAVRRVRVPEAAEREKKGLEETARRLRYAVLEEEADKAGCDWIATAHTRNDLAETVLFHALRGTGVRGLAGIAPHAGRLIRPLLGFGSEEIIEYLKKNNEPFVTDSTNSDERYSRNFIRQTLLPAAEAAHPGAVRSLARLAENARSYRALASALADREEEKNPVPFSEGRALISIVRPLAEKEETEPVLYEILSRMTEHFSLSISCERFSAILALLKAPDAGKLIEAGAGAAFRIEGDFLSAGPEREAGGTQGERQDLHEGRQIFGADRTAIEISPKIQKNGENIHKNHLILRLSSDKIIDSLFARTPLPGDRIVIDGHRRGVMKLLAEAKIPPKYRSRIPLICDGGGILWVPYAGLCDRARPENALSHRVVSLSGPLFDDINRFFHSSK